MILLLDIRSYQRFNYRVDKSGSPSGNRTTVKAKSGQLDETNM